MHVKRLVSLFLSVALVSCAPISDRPREGQTTFGDQAGRKQPRETEEAPQAEGVTPPVPAENPTPSAPQQANAPEPRRDTPPQDEPVQVVTLPKTETPPPLLATGREESAIPEYTIPESIRKRLLQIQPYMELPEESLEYQVFNQHLTIDTKKKTITFTAVVRVPRQKDEPIALSCGFDPAQSPWMCNDMFPTDVNVAKQRRYQATFKCLDPWTCKMEALQLWAVINGKRQPPKLFQAEGFEIRRAAPEAPEYYELPDYENVVPEFKLEDVAQPAKSQPAPTKPAPAAPAAPAPVTAPKAPTPAAPKAPPVHQETPEKKTENPPAESKPATPETSTPPAKPKEVTDPPKAVPAPKPVAPPPVAPPKPENSAVKPAPAPTKMTEKEIVTALNDQKTTLELRAPITTPAPKVSEYSVPGVESIRTEMKSGVPIQAVGSHNGAYSVLRNADQFPAQGPGYVSRHRNAFDFGTQLTVNLLGKAFEAVERQYPNRPPFWLMTVSRKTGGAVEGQASHRTGLDADIAFPGVRSSKGEVGLSFDKERFWFFMKQVTCAENRPVIALLLAESIKQTMCRFVQNDLGEDTKDPKSCAYRTLQAIRHWPGHHNHIHVRLRCPEDTHCQNEWIPLSAGTGCSASK